MQIETIVDLAVVYFAGFFMEFTGMSGAHDIRWPFKFIMAFIGNSLQNWCSLDTMRRDATQPLSIWGKRLFSNKAIWISIKYLIIFFFKWMTKKRNELKNECTTTSLCIYIPCQPMDHRRIQFVMTILLIYPVDRSFHLNISTVAEIHGPYLQMSTMLVDIPNSDKSTNSAHK